MKQFLYQGPFQARSIKDGSKIIFDGNLVPGKIYDLPENHPEIEALIVGGLLIAQEPAQQTEPKTKREAK
ncbi:hypothetical protein [Bartonella sp. HY761]|uniref:hypothetical protein n=1 Tax=Bartonella sp. HY761 TaxID=2979330 RepID=UPI00220D4B20|nr:hypothetical protein [Bartonella sp. HY761]UXN07515.1 hypothetical protein N6A79_05895 [Bartonella sp. HY761]